MVRIEDFLGPYVIPSLTSPRWHIKRSYCTYCPRHTQRQTMDWLPRSPTIALRHGALVAIDGMAVDNRFVRTVPILRLIAKEPKQVF
jgi:hypothetical protein